MIDLQGQSLLGTTKFSERPESSDLGGAALSGIGAVGAGAVSMIGLAVSNTPHYIGKVAEYFDKDTADYFYKAEESVLKYSVDMPVNAIKQARLNQKTTGEQLIFGAVDSLLPLALGPGGGAIMQGVRRATEESTEGDLGRAYGLGALTGLTYYAGARLGPISPIKTGITGTIAQKAVTGAASNVGLGMAQRYGENVIEGEQKYEIADQTQVLLDAVVGAGFGVLPDAAKLLSRAQKDAVLNLNELNVTNRVLADRIDELTPKVVDDAELGIREIEKSLETGQEPDFTQLKSESSFRVYKPDIVEESPIIHDPIVREQPKAKIEMPAQKGELDQAYQENIAEMQSQGFFQGEEIKADDWVPQSAYEHADSDVFIVDDNAMTFKEAKAKWAEDIKNYTKQEEEFNTLAKCIMGA